MSGQDQVLTSAQSATPATADPLPSSIPSIPPVSAAAGQPSRPGAGHLDTVETHTATLFFVGDRVYKIKKPVNLGFVDYRTRQARLAACEAEVRLNRRLAPDVYLGIGDIRDAAGTLHDHMVVMRRLPDERRLSSLVISGARVQPQLRAIARRLAVFHEQCQTSPEIARAGGLAALQALWLEGMMGVEPFRDLLDGEVVDEIGRLALRYLDGRAALFAERQRAGRVRDGHGDLLAEDVFCLDDGPRILDCLEFDQRLRVGDVLGDVAFLAMDLERLGHPEAARYFLDAYREFSGETHPASLEHLYIAYRAFVRAKVAGIRDHQGEPGAADAARELAAMALRHLRRGRVRLVLVGGLPGTGKSTLSQGLADGADGWVRIGSDAVRKGLAGLAAEQPAADAFGAGLYGPQPTEATYSELMQRARTALERGESVVLDASWTSGAHRQLAARIATETDADLVELCCVAPREVAAARIARRAALGGDASDASIAVHAAMAVRNDPWPTAHEVPTTGPVDDAMRAVRALVA
ncbi:AAA family ATPase [Candidatus Frankia alpina]|uniref:bifunctional aminoglycoside phosphotransferase/ATP-binding protein n=1 Tax=Candidatus Frankia alpina TaxID=2699483 RepID=UPI0013D8D3D5|nr:AAA family ATPase [Candidatus Frankia alpina]